MSKKKWVCQSCGDSFKTKGELVEHLKDDFENATTDADWAVGQLEDLGVDPYED